ncbi:GMC oxidoreductase [Polynucleobacter sp. IMCC 29146]|uniref:GMC oxidoreductase n=1 Tax=Polynucleobacter sp. IMCC 29146 TaxID=2780953 RepID=UPI001F26A9DF|nr:GMC oxidoreductase [Polynucleobacter sp. IMCC 29146]MCE7530636.1 hypothetical protein [Polynucleobacter sp. IMCC 29146]
MKNNNLPVCIIGSGLAAMSAALSLVERGVRPTILDVGLSLSDDISKLASEMGGVEPELWSESHKTLMFGNRSLDKEGIPLKLAFGSSYFYGVDSIDAPIQSLGGEFPPFSYAQGGLSVGWGASALPADPRDLSDWPSETKNLREHYQFLLRNIAYSAVDDRLSSNFPVYSSVIDPIKIQPGNLALLNDMEKANIFVKDQITFGQARSLVQATDSKNGLGCKYCGNCMSGCVYGAIFKSDKILKDLIAHDKIDYFCNHHVLKLAEDERGVTVYFKNKNNFGKLTFSKVFLAAGAVNSTRIILKSKNIYNSRTLLKAVPGFVMPMIRIGKANNTWPKANTLSGIFLEYKPILDFWAHCQISIPNELVLKKIDLQFSSNWHPSAIKSLLSRHLVVATVTLHSNFGNGYALSLVRDGVTENDTLVSSREPPGEAKNAIREAMKKLSGITRKFGCYPLSSFALDSTISNGYHIGGSMPMKSRPVNSTDTDILGRPLGFQRVHVIDSSIFPTIPATTIGLLAMANSARIIKSVHLE